ncbi:unnamed protein product [Periconia digitata]|uniref:Membrane anchor Opy2 N-terminal domain-containing protein n=1 Tax=Periconia digitata TaxID=1303443 RepID=A0A9W4UF40_9PLEO|nr:unnamed protein product [Periconia digitata]
MATITKRDIENVVRTIFRRCQLCDDTTPTCAGIECPEGQQCVQLSTTCDTCAMALCRTDPNSAAGLAPPVEQKKTNVGAIAGGAVGGALALAIILFLFYKFCLKGRRQRYHEENWQAAEMTMHEKGHNDVASHRSTRASTYTVASMASSVLTRASNIIQIAYIPGVTNRSGPGSPDVLVPPVPPIPAMSPSSRNTGYSEQHFFVPDNFRNSTASGSTADVRSSYARTSLAPSLATTRASVASTVYRQNAIVSPLPAQTIVRGKAAVVSVKSSGSNSPIDTPTSSTPPVPIIDPKHNAKTLRVQMPAQGNSKLSPSNSVRSTATLGKVRALNITKRKNSDATPPKSSESDKSELTNSDTLVPTPRPLTEVSVASTDDGMHGRAQRAGEVDSDSDLDSDDDHSRARRSLLRNSAATSELSTSPDSTNSPFSDAHSSISSFDRPQLETRFTSNSGGLYAPPMTPIQEESNKRASDSNSSKRGQSPFADENKSDLK